MEKLVFVGEIIKGRSGHATLWVPGRNDLETAPSDWPERLYAGSLNVLIPPTGYPQQMQARGIPLTVKSLDVAGCKPEFTIPQHLMRHNMLTATDAMPHRGTAQVWRAILFADGHTIACWVLRRLGSGLEHELELVSGEGIRCSYELSEDVNWPAIVHVMGRWVALTWRWSGQLRSGLSPAFLAAAHRRRVKPEGN